MFVRSGIKKHAGVESVLESALYIVLGDGPHESGILGVEREFGLAEDSTYRVHGV